jgi:hypothetical protein
MDHELVTAHAGEQISGAKLPGQARGDLYQQAVPDVVSETVVDLLELVPIQQQYGALTCEAARRLGTSVYKARRLGSPVNSSVLA